MSPNMSFVRLDLIYETVYNINLRSRQLRVVETSYTLSVFGAKGIFVLLFFRLEKFFNFSSFTQPRFIHV